MRRTLRAVGALLAVAVFGLILYVGLNWRVLSTFPQMPSSYEAKEYCSCRWVSGRSDTFCAQYVHQTTVPMQGREIDEATRSVTSTSLWQSNSARLVDDQRGCVLDR